MTATQIRREASGLIQVGGNNDPVLAPCADQGSVGDAR
jgi:hypothetical protein